MALLSHDSSGVQKNGHGEEQRNHGHCGKGRLQIDEEHRQENRQHQAGYEPDDDMGEQEIQQPGVLENMVAERPQIPSSEKAHGKSPEMITEFEPHPGGDLIGGGHHLVVADNGKCTPESETQVYAGHPPPEKRRLERTFIQRDEEQAEKGQGSGGRAVFKRREHNALVEQVQLVAGDLSYQFQHDGTAFSVASTHLLKGAAFFQMRWYSEFSHKRDS